MKKFILSLALSAVTMTGFTAFAATDNDKKSDVRPCGATAAACEMRCPDGKPALCPFEGLNLTDAQKEKIKALRQNCKAAKADTKKQKREARRAERRQRLDDIKAILTPEQYVAYLENLALSGRKPGKEFRHKGPGRDCPRGMRGDCPRGPRPDCPVQGRGK